MHKNTVTNALLNILHVLHSIPELNSFRLVGGTAIALQMGHRKSIDIDFFSNEKSDRAAIKKALHAKFQTADLFISEHSLSAELDGVRVELYDEWAMPFLRPVVSADGLRLAALQDLAAFKLSAITGRREKKDYIDLYFLFRALGAESTLKEFRTYDPLLSMKSILFALGEVKVAGENKSPMPDMTQSVAWKEVEDSMILAAKDYIKMAELKKREQI